MTCDDTGLLLIDLHAGALDPEQASALRQHLGGCARCARVEREEVVLTELLRGRLPRPSAPPRLRRDLEARVAAAGEGPARAGAPRRRWAWPVLAAGACCAALALWLVPRAPTAPSLVDEAVNDHLRVLVASRPDIESGGTHQVRPWFEGRLDFAPPVPDLESAGLRLVGGSVGYFLDRRTAIVEYQLRLHRVTLLVFRADGLTLPVRPGAAASARGIHAVLWRDGALGLALVSDVGAPELERVAALLAQEGPKETR